MSGLELQRRLQAAGVTVPIIYCTAESDPDGRLRRRLLQAEAMAVLYKPFDPERLLRLVEDALPAGQSLNAADRKGQSDVLRWTGREQRLSLG
ncbi:MAG: response regulator receiver protein [Gammaproteobacteria bacterium]|nr:response regulator receiver protein [Gammaproteobacteria bacterium]